MLARWPGGEVDVSAGTVVDVPNGITDEHALRVHAERLLVAQVVTNAGAGRINPEGQRWGDACGHESFLLENLFMLNYASASTVEALVRMRLSSTILRGTAQESGSEISSHLLLPPLCTLKVASSFN